MDKVNVPEISGKSKHYIGRNHGDVLYMSKPSFDCGWYWGFGYVGNSRCHMHFNGILNHNHDKNWFDSFRTEFTDVCVALQDDQNLWKFIETMRSLYTLRKAADLYYMGGSHCTTPVVSLKDPVMYEKIVTEQMPALFEAVVDILEKR